MTQNLSVLCQALGYQFKNTDYLVEALTHRSKGSKNYERLEFLGDAILNFIITDQLYHRFPGTNEGVLSRYRASLVKGDTLSELARELDLGRFLNLGPGELKSGGFTRDSILADGFEAIIGAMFLDGGIESCGEFLLTFYRERIDAIPENAEMKDPKTRLQEHLQGQRKSLPNYQVLSVVGESHNQTFHIICTIEGIAQSVEGEGTSRRRAEQDAAAKMLHLLGVDSSQ